MLSRITGHKPKQALYHKFPSDESDTGDIELDHVLESESSDQPGQRSVVPIWSLLSPLQTWLTPAILHFKVADTIHEEDVPAVATDIQSLRRMLEVLLKGRWARFIAHPLVGGRLLLGFVLEIATLCFTLSSPVILRHLLQEPRWWLVALWTVTNTAGICTGRTRDQVCRLHASTIAAGLKSTLVDKAQKLSRRAQLRFPPASVMNISTRDVSFVTSYVLKVHDIWSAALQLAVIFVLLLWLLGGAAVWSYAFMVILFFTQSKANLLAGASVKGYSESNDKRLGLLREFLGGVKGIKLLGIEHLFARRVEQARAIQQGFIQTYLRLTFSLFTTMNQMIPGLMAAVGVLAYCWAGHELEAATVFPALALFEMTYGPATKLSLAVTRQFSVLPCIRRISSLLTAEELFLEPWSRADAMQDTAIKVRDAAFAYPVAEEQDEAFALHIEHLEIRPNSLTVVTGPVGGGKSTFLWSLAGALPPSTRDSVHVQGPVFLAPQEPWIFSGTLQDNIIFKSALETDWYDQVIHMCGLRQDIAALPGGSETTLGAGGVNISGGQRARVSLARAVYSRSPVLLLDDPLAAVDPHVARHIIENCLFKLPQTVILVTHVMAVARKASLVVVLDNGEVVDHGSPAQLKERLYLNSEIDAVLSTEKAASEAVTSDNTSRQDKPLETETLVQEEERATGTVDISVILFYAKHVGGRRFMLMAGSAFATSLWTRCLVGFWFVWWLQDKWHWTVNGYLGGYLTLTVLQAGSIGIMGILLVSGSLRASSNMHEKITQKLFAAALRFFEAQPAGRIINRLSTDIEAVDTDLMNAVDGLFVAAGQMMASMLVILWTAPLVLVLVPVTVIVVWRIQGLYRVSARELRRLSSLLGSRVATALDETLQGTGIIRALRGEYFFLDRHSLALLKSTDTNMVKDSLDTWVTVRAEGISVVVVMCCGLLLVSGLLASAQAGLALSTAISLTKNVHLLLWAIVQIEIEMNSVERLKYYIEEMPCEKSRGSTLQGAWPSTGQIRFENATVRYKTRAQPALDKLNLVISSGKKVAIVGRTGSGKSSLVAALSRLVELDAGRIVIDGVDIAAVQLQRLRQAVHVLPQEPLVFAGTLRQNLDADGTHSDEELWHALDIVGLRHRFEQSSAAPPGARGSGLDMGLDVGGANCSSGELQLVCMARAALKNPQILIMDEATAALDAVSRAQVDKLLQTHFQHSTVLCIMHRVESALDMDQVIVVDNGKVVEEGSPHALMAKPTSRLAGMVKAGAAT